MSDLIPRKLPGTEDRLEKLPKHKKRTAAKYSRNTVLANNFLLFILKGLHVVELLIVTVPGKEILVLSALHYAAFVQNDDLVRCLDGR